jgi:TatD DNase family protein
VRAALGLHPQLVADRAGELPLWERHLPETRYVGEVGLDAGPRFYKSLDTQKHVFRSVLERCVEAGGKILTVHSVRSVPAVLEMVERYLPADRGTVVLHWFTGSKSDARRAATLGCYFSVNAEMTRSDRGRALVAELPIGRILTETDGPFTQIDGRPSEPADVKATVTAIADIRKVPVNAVTTAAISNLRSLLGDALDRSRRIVIFVLHIHPICSVKVPNCPLPTTLLLRCGARCASLGRTSMMRADADDCRWRS